MSSEQNKLAERMAATEPFRSLLYDFVEKPSRRSITAREIAAAVIEMVAQESIPSLAERDDLREAAMWVVLNWDNEHSQHTSMPALRAALGLPPGRPTREEARARLDRYIGISR